MKKLIRLVLLVGMIALAVWVGLNLFPNPKQAIRNRLNKLAQLASYSAREGNLSRIANIQKLGLLFSDDAQVTVDVPGLEAHTFNRREELMQAAMAAKSVSTAIKAEFLDMNIELGSGNLSALVDLTLKAKVTGDNDMIAQELKFTMKKINGDWLITRIETVKTLKP